MSRPVFDPGLAPPGVDLRLDAYRTGTNGNWWQTRPTITPRLQLVHTNGATREGSIEAAINWANSGPYTRTHAHYQVDRDRAAKLIPTDRRGIGNATRPSAQQDHGNVSDWSIVIETADPGYPTPGEDVGFVGTQAETVATILAYESVVWNIPLEYPTEWFGPGTGCHTEPFGFPHWTLFDGKVCPGRSKKQEMRDLVLPRAREIVAAWTTPPSTIPPGAEDMAHFAKVADDDSALLIVDATSARWLQNAEEVRAAETVCQNTPADPIILLPVDCEARVWLGRLPHYKKGANAGRVRVTAELWAQTV